MSLSNSYDSQLYLTALGYYHGLFFHTPISYYIQIQSLCHHDGWASSPGDSKEVLSSRQATHLLPVSPPKSDSHPAQSDAFPLSAMFRTSLSPPGTRIIYSGGSSSVTPAQCLAERSTTNISHLPATCSLCLTTPPPPKKTIGQTPNNQRSSPTYSVFFHRHKHSITTKKQALLSSSSVK